MKKDKTIRLTLDQFHKWKSSIQEMQKAELSQKVCTLELKLLQKELELTSLKSQLFAIKSLPASNDLVAKTKDEYNQIKVELENALGISLNNKAINETTFEINDLKQGEK